MTSTVRRLAEPIRGDGWRASHDRSARGRAARPRCVPASRPRAPPVGLVGKRADRAPRRAPPSIPAGREPFRSAGDACSLWLPPARDRFPAPIRWEACAAGSPGGPGCRQLAVDRDHRGHPAIAGAPSLSVERGVARLFRTRVAVTGPGGPSSYLEWVVGAVDGPLDFAMRMSADGEWRCVATEQQLGEGRFAIRPLPPPRVWNAPRPALDADAARRQREVDRFIRDELYPGYRILDTTQTYSGNVVDWVDPASEPGSQISKRPEFADHVRGEADEASFAEYLARVRTRPLARDDQGSQRRPTTR